MNELDRNSEPLCETSEPGERLIKREELLPISLEIGRRVLEVFGYQRLSSIVFRLRSTAREINAVINGEILPSAELLIGIRRITGASADWILTGEGQKFVSAASVLDQAPNSLPLAVLTVRRERTRKNNASVFLSQQRSETKL